MFKLSCIHVLHFVGESEVTKTRLDANLNGALQGENFASVTAVAAFECVTKDVKHELETPGEHVLNGRNFRQIISRHNYFAFRPAHGRAVVAQLLPPCPSVEKRARLDRAKRK